MTEGFNPYQGFDEFEFFDVIGLESFNLGFNPYQGFDEFELSR